jgi:hypothetical protein
MAKKAGKPRTRAKAGGSKDPKASPDPPAKPIKNRIGPGTTRSPKRHGTMGNTTGS